MADWSSSASPVPWCEAAGDGIRRVAGLIHPVEAFALPAVEWLTEGQWRQDRIPTRGEYLIRPGEGQSSIAPLSGLCLELQAPYLALVGAD